MKKAEIIIGALAVVSIILNIFLVPSSTVLLVLLTSALSFLYGYLSFALFNEVRLRHIFKKESYQNISKFRIIGAVLLGMALATTVLGVLFTLMSWPGSFVNLTIGMTGVTIALAVAVAKNSKAKSVYFTNIFKRIAIIGGIGGILLLLPKDSLVKFKYRNYPSYLEALKEAQANPENQELWKKLQEERDKMN